MPEEGLTIKIKGLDKLTGALDKFQQKIAQNMSAAGKQAGKELLDTKGLRKYPAETAANWPPTPYYVRGKGMQYKAGSSGGSERLGTQWTVRTERFRTTIRNDASYAQWVHGDSEGKYQARHMAKIGWKKLLDTAKGMISKLTKIYQAWVDKTIRDLGL
jgi:hypothetical protein